MRAPSKRSRRWLEGAAGFSFLLCVGAGSARAQGAWLEAPTLEGTSGIVNTPHAYVIPHGGLRLGFGLIDRQWAYHARGLSDNHHHFLTIGFAPRVEISFRASYFPDDQLTADSPRGTVDRGGSGRILVLREGRRFPALAVGADDARGTRRFHALYAVASKSVATSSRILRARASVGYGSDVLKAKTHVLDGVFGGGEVLLGGEPSLLQLRVGPRIVLSLDGVGWGLDYDTEKWNTVIRLFAFRHLAASIAFLDFEAPAGGISWTHQF